MTVPTIPYKFIPRPYQLPIFQAMNSGFNRAVVLWHRRAGKDKTFLNLVASEMVKRVGIYYYFFPTYAQAKKVIWKGIDKNGMPFLDHFPNGLLGRHGKNETEMSIEFSNGSIFQLIGTDKYASIRGTNPIGCVFSEFSYQDPGAWDIVNPILDENGGWALFNFTPQGKNHAYKLFTMAEKNKEWFTQKLTVDDTKDEQGKPVISQAQIQKKRNEGQSEDFIQQEYYISFDAGIRGAYYSDKILAARKSGRWGLDNIYDPILPVYTIWDLGIGDDMAIWFAQFVGKEARLIDYFSDHGEGLQYYIDHLGSLKYQYGDHFAPFDIEVKELGTGVSRWQTACDKGIIFRIAPKLSIDDGIDAVRKLFPDMYFDNKCQKGMDALVQYRKEWDEKRKEFKRIPYHDWASHAADAMRYLAVSYNMMFPGEIHEGDSRETANINEEF